MSINRLNLLQIYLAILSVAAAIIFVIPLFDDEFQIVMFYVYAQDRWLIAASAISLMLCQFSLSAKADSLSISRTSVWAIALILVVLCLAGHFWLLSGYDQSRDEQMATFDASVFASGLLVQPLPALWRDHSDALNTIFMYPAESRSAWISGYLPMNAALRALVDLVAIQELTSPLMAGVGALALWGCARKIWPDQREAAVVALLLYIGSGQIIFTGMTSFAMTGHLALNLLWLWLFLQRKWMADVAALLVGFVAVGLHQPVFHPLFAGPLLLLMLREKAWRRAALYFFGYLAIGIFWAKWPTYIWELTVATSTVPSAAPEGVDFLSRLIATVTGPIDRLVMIPNLIRFIAWQHVLLLPLCLVGLYHARKSAMAIMLTVGIVLTTLFMTITLPFQGNGFGYRYLHGLIGNCILLAVFGWMAFADQSRWRNLLVRTTIAGLVFIIPLQAWMAHRYYDAFAQSSKQIAALGADYIVVAGNIATFGQDLALNPPKLDHRPIRLLHDSITPGLAGLLCANTKAAPVTVQFIRKESLQPIHALYEGRIPTDEVDYAATRAEFATAGCTVIY